MSARFIVGDAPGGALFACIEPDTRFACAALATRKFAASLTPYRTEEAARLALYRAGAVKVSAV